MAYEDRFGGARANGDGRRGDGRISGNRHGEDEAPGSEPSEADLLDEEFPLGDGTADTDAAVRCPYCGEEVEIALDPGSGAVQEYVEDCQVCCRPWRVFVSYGEDGRAEVALEPEQGG